MSYVILNTYTHPKILRGIFTPPEKMHRWAKKRMESCSMSLIIRGLQVNTVILTTSQDGQHQHVCKTTKSAGEAGRKRSPPHCRWEGKLGTTTVRTAQSSIKSWELKHDPQSHAWACIQRNGLEKIHTCDIHSSTTHGAKIWKHAYLTVDREMDKEWRA